MPGRNTIPCTRETLQAPIPGPWAKKYCKCPGVSRGGWAMLELTPALLVTCRYRAGESTQPKFRFPWKNMEETQNT